MKVTLCYQPLYLYCPSSLPSSTLATAFFSYLLVQFSWLCSDAAKSELLRMLEEVSSSSGSDNEEEEEEEEDEEEDRVDIGKV